MSGGRFDYRNDDVCDNLFGWLYPGYGLDSERHKEDAKRAADLRNERDEQQTFGLRERRNDDG